MSDELRNTLGALDGAEIEGGCECCNAYQRIVNNGSGVFTIKVFHDDWCPVLKGDR